MTTVLTTPVMQRLTLLPVMFTAVIMTVSLFMIMQALIDTNIQRVEQPTKRPVDPVMLKPPPPATKYEPPFEILPEVLDPPDPLPTITSLDPDQQHLLIPGNEAPGFDEFSVVTGSGTSSIVPIFRVAPDYPHRAQSRGIEGFVDLLFDVTATGRTDNIRVIEAQPPGIFEKAASGALKKWKYKPPSNAGVTYRQSNMTTRIRFSMEQ